MPKTTNPDDDARPDSAAERARQGEIILRKPWQKMVFFGGLAASVMVMVVVIVGLV